MARAINILDYTGVGGGTTNNTSSSFTPQAGFLLKVYGTIASNVTYTVEMISETFPDSDGQWFAASGNPLTGTSVTLTAANSGLEVNFFKGYKYRIKRTGNGTQSDALQFHYGHLTVLQWTAG